MDPICHKCTEIDYRQFPILRKYNCDYLVQMPDDLFYDIPMICCMVKPMEDSSMVKPPGGRICVGGAEVKPEDLSDESVILSEFKTQREQVRTMMSPPYGISKNLRHAMSKLYKNGMYGFFLNSKYRMGGRQLDLVMMGLNSVTQTIVLFLGNGIDISELSDCQKSVFTNVAYRISAHRKKHKYKLRYRVNSSDLTLKEFEHVKEKLAEIDPMVRIEGQW